MQLRRAKIEDAETVAQILSTSRLAYLPYAKSPHSLNDVCYWVREKLIPTGGVVIAQIESEDIGVLATSVAVADDMDTADQNAIGWIDQLYLAPDYVGQGIGTQLLSHALSFLPRPVRLWTFQQNDRAIRFYERHGFKAIKHTNGEDNEERCPDILYELK